MCTISLASLALTAVSSAVGVASQSAQMTAQAAANKATAESITESTLRSQEALGLAHQQDAAATAEAKMDAKLEAARAVATARTAAGEGGVSGVSVERQLQDFYRRELDYGLTLDQNLEARQIQREYEAEGIAARGATQINQLPAAIPPNWLDAGLRIGGKTIDLYNQTGGTFGLR